jgi:outer membrane receptor protein involved in Fe transport
MGMIAQSIAAVQITTITGWYMSRLASLAMLAAVTYGTTSANAIATPTATTYDSGVAPQPLADALSEFARHWGLKLIYASDLATGKRSDGAPSGLSLTEALQRILSGTGLTARWLNDKTVSIQPSEDDQAAYRVTAGMQETPGNGQHPDPQHKADSAEENEGPPAKPTQASDLQRTTPLNEVIVTGTHISGVPNSSPLITIQREDIERSGYETVGDVMRSLPQNFGGGSSPQAQVGSAPGAGNLSYSGSSAPNLRGLGPGSTLTMINGHRLPQDMPTGAIDISGIPLSIVERIDVVTDGASATYGSDAVAGVVNFILKRPFDGVETDGSIGGATDGGGFDRRAGVLFGKTWSSGGAMLNYDWENIDAVYSSQRSFTSTAGQPSTLLPSSSRQSVFATVSEDLSNRFSVFGEGLYVSRASENFQTLPPSPSTIRPSTVDQYVATVGINAVLTSDWNATVVGSTAQQDTSSSIYRFTAVAPTPTVAQRELLAGSSRSMEGDLTGTLVRAWAGDIRLALGIGDRKETFRDGSPSNERRLASGNRSIDYAFAELAVPLIASADASGTNRLDLNISGRFEDYSDVGHKSVPKVGLVYQVAPEARLRASWGRSFRAPTLTDLHGANGALLLPLPDPNSATGSSVVLVPEGGSPHLKPETATTWTFSVDYSPTWLTGFKSTITYFNINYLNRIGQIANGFAALTDPTNAPFVTSSPSASEQQQFIDAAATGFGFTNITGTPYQASNVAAIVDFRPQNIASQKIDGADLLADYKVPVRIGRIDAFLNGTYMDILQKVTPGSPEQKITGTAFNPPRFRARGGVNWTVSRWSLTGTVNYLGSEINNAAQTGGPEVSAWTTFDAQMGLSLQSIGMHMRLSVLNVFDRAPPYLQFNTIRSGINYDVLNATPLGRFVSLDLVKSW